MELLLGNLNYSSWSIRALLVARASDLQIAETVLPLLQETTKDVVRSKTGFHKVPALVDGSIAVRDSLAITEYIAEHSAPGRVWPTDKADRALARAVVAEMHSSFMALRTQCPVDIRSRYPDTVLEAATRADVARVLEIWAECRAKRLKDGPFLFGDWSAADAFYAPVVTRFTTYGVETEGADAAYCAAVLAHPDMADIIKRGEAEPWVMIATPEGQVVGRDRV